MSDEFERPITGCLLGAAVGDALGLPREGLPPDCARRMFGDEIRHALFRGKGMVSDDTEHLLLTASTLIESGHHFEKFLRGLARRLRMWFCLLPPAAGLATLRGCFWLALFVPPERTGVNSAGNGALMRVPIIGLMLAEDVQRMRRFVRASTRITHTDPRAERAAQIVALATGWHVRNPEMPADTPPEAILEEVVGYTPEPDEDLAAVLSRATDPRPLDEDLPHGPSGYAYQSLLAILHTWLHHRHDYRVAIETVIRLGGDTDTTAAITGAMVGAVTGPEAIPEEWLAGLAEWPRDVAWMRALGEKLAQSWDAEDDVRAPSWHPGATLLRNMWFAGLAIGHGLYRLVRLGGRI